VEGLVQAFGSGAMTNSIRELRDVDCIFITGSNTAEAHPVISYEVVRAARQGANLIIVDPRRIPLVEHATLFLQVKPGTDIYVFLAIMHIIIREGWADNAFISHRTEGYQELADSLIEYTPERASLMSGVPVEQIEKAARLYALGERASGVSRFNDERGHSAILYAMGITQRSSGTDIVMTLANLAMMTGQVGKPSSGVNPLRGQSNVQGACDTGCLVNLFPGYINVGNEEKRSALAQAWGVESLPGQVGLTIVEAMNAAVDGKVRALYVMGENPLMSDPNTNHVEHALRSLDLLVAQDIFPSETAQLAHVILPAAAALEKSGTFTNTERRVQLIAPVLAPPGEARPDWQITAEIAARFDEKMGRERPTGYWQFPGPSAIFNEIAAVTPIYAGMRYERLAPQGLQWPCPDSTHPGTPFLHGQKFSRGLGLFHAIHANDPAEQTDAEYPLILTTGRILYHYHTGTMTRRSEPLAWREPHGTIEINPQDAARLNLQDEGQVVVKSRRGTVTTRAKITNRVPQGTVFMAFHWREAPANMLTQDFALDPVAKIPEYKVCAVRLEVP
jgi:formate dehydrogenase alpha subunit